MCVIIYCAGIYVACDFVLFGFDIIKEMFQWCQTERLLHSCSIKYFKILCFSSDLE